MHIAGDPGCGGLFGVALARWFYAPTGRKVIAQGKAKRRPGIRYGRIFASPERAEPAVRQSMRACSALSGLWRIGAAAYPRAIAYDPGCRFALPWAISLCPFGANDPVKDRCSKNSGTVPEFFGSWAKGRMSHRAVLPVDRLLADVLATSSNTNSFRPHT